MDAGTPTPVTKISILYGVTGLNFSNIDANGAISDSVATTIKISMLQR
jgi:hypothetical protein